MRAPARRRRGGRRAGGCGGRREPLRQPDIVAPTSARSERAPATWARGLPGVRWTQRLDTSKLVARTDGMGNVVLAANLGDAAGIGGRAVQPHHDAGQDVVIAALAPDGVARWTTVLGSEKLDTVEDMAVDGRGFVTVAGSYGAPMVLGGDRLLLEPTYGPFSSYLARLNPQGALLAGRGPAKPEQRVLGAMEAGALVAAGWHDVEIQAVDDHLTARWGARCVRKGTSTRPAVASLGGGAVVAGDAGAGVACLGPNGPGGTGTPVDAGGAKVFVARILDGGPDRVGEGRDGRRHLRRARRVAGGTDRAGDERERSGQRAHARRGGEGARGSALHGRPRGPDRRARGRRGRRRRGGGRLRGNARRRGDAPRGARTRRVRRAARAGRQSRVGAALRRRARSARRGGGPRWSRRRRLDGTRAHPAGGRSGGRTIGS